MKTAKLSTYCKINKYLELEIFDQPLYNIFSNIELVNFSKQDWFFNRESFATLKASKMGIYKVKDIIFPKSFTQISIENELFNLLSSKYNLRYIMKIAL